MALLRSRSISSRTLWALALAVLLGLRLLSPPGFMPTFAHGGVTIIICPDAEPAGSMPRDHHSGHPKAHHQPCPYASAASFGTANGDAPLLTVPATIELAPLAARSFAFAATRRKHERPPLRGPPISA